VTLILRKLLLISQEPKFKKIFKKILSLFSPDVLLGALMRQFNRKEYFLFNNNKLKYFYHSYNNHRLTERSIEIPIIRYYLEKTINRDLLEIGNVINHYYSYFQTLIDSKIVIDKYEKGFGVINTDIHNYIPIKKFNFICSISTFEHMDSDRGRNPDFVKGKSELPTYAADNIVHIINNLLNFKGHFIITAPVGYTVEWDKMLFELKLLDKEFLNVKSVKIYYYKKTNQIEWIQTNRNYAKKARFNFPFPGVNVLSIIEIIK